MKYIKALSLRLIFVFKILIGIALGVFIYVGIYMPFIIIYPVIWLFSGVPLIKVLDWFNNTVECKLYDKFWEDKK